MKLFIIFVLTAGVSLIPTSAMESMQLKSTISSKLRKQDKWGSIGNFFGGHKDSAKPKPESQESSHMTCCEQVIGAIKEVLGSSTAVSAAGRTLSSRWWHSHCPMWYRWLGWSCTDTKERAIRTLNSYCATHDPEKSIHEFDELPKEIASWLENVKNPAIESSSNGSGGSATAEKSFGGAVSSLLGSAAKVIASISEKSGTTSPSCAATTCSGYPAFIQAPTGKANQTRAAQATLATAVATVVRDTLQGSSLSLRTLVVYEVYRKLSGNGAGAYYSDTVWGPVSELPVHLRDLVQRGFCSNDGDCKYAVGRREEARVGAFRTLNALEVSILYACADPSKFCAPGFLPLSGYPKGKELQSLWGALWRYSVVDLGEALWKPKSNGATCGISKKFVPNSASDTSY